MPRTVAAVRLLGVAWLRRNGCAHKGMLRRANVAGGLALLAYAVGGYAYETTARPAVADTAAVAAPATADVGDCGCA